jgi:hypothetical protein
MRNHRTHKEQTMKLISNWKQSWKFTSVQTALILAAANGLFAVLPMLFSYVTLPVYALIMMFGNIGIVVLRLIAQTNIKQ